MIIVKVDGQARAKRLKNNDPVLFGNKWYNTEGLAKDIKADESFCYNGYWYTAEKIMSLQDEFINTSIEVEYITYIYQGKGKDEGEQLSIYYDGRGLGWHSWLFGRGDITGGMNVDDVKNETEKKLGIKITNLEYFQY